MLQAQHGPRQPLQKAQPIVLRVNRQVRMIAQQQGFAKQAGEQQRGEDKEARSGEMDHVGVELLERVVNPAQPQRECNAAVQRETEARDVNDARAGKLGRGVSRALGDDHKHVIASLA